MRKLKNHSLMCLIILMCIIRATSAQNSRLNRKKSHNINSLLKDSGFGTNKDTNNNGLLAHSQERHWKQRRPDAIVHQRRRKGHG